MGSPEFQLGCSLLIHRVTFDGINVLSWQYKLFIDLTDRLPSEIRMKFVLRFPL